MHEQLAQYCTLTHVAILLFLDYALLTNFFFVVMPVLADHKRQFGIKF